MHCVMLTHRQSHLRAHSSEVCVQRHMTRMEFKRKKIAWCPRSLLGLWLVTRYLKLGGLGTRNLLPHRLEARSLKSECGRHHTPPKAPRRAARCISPSFWCFAGNPQFVAASLQFPVYMWCSPWASSLPLPSWGLSLSPDPPLLMTTPVRLD